MPIDESRELNLANWNERVAHHVGSDSYGIDELVADPTRISSVVRHDVDVLPPLAGRRVVHLQCHIGTDTLSLARLGASVTGYDFSEPAIEAACHLFERAGAAGSFEVGELYDAPDVLGEGGFDVVYTSVGALCWLPDIVGWARVVRRLLAPGGSVFVRDGHPMLWTLDHDREDDQLVVLTPYFETQEPMTWNDPGTYADPDARLANTTTKEWNHGLGEIVSALLTEGFALEHLAEHRVIDWQPWHLFESVPGEEGSFWQLPEHLRDRVPLMYSLRASLPT